MKKHVFCLTVLCLVAISTACGRAEDPENLFEMPESQIQDTSLSSAEQEPGTIMEQETDTETESEAGIESEIGKEDQVNPEAGDLTQKEPEMFDLEVLSVPYQYGNMQRNAPPGNFMEYEGLVVFTYFSNGGYRLYTYDKETGEVSQFCKDATCRHDSVKCTSNAAVQGNLEQYDGKLYALNYGSQIMELKDGGFEVIAEGAVYNFWHANGRLYAVSRDGSLVEFEEGSRNPRILIDEYTDMWNVVCGNYLYGCGSKGIRRVDLTAQEPQAEVVVQNRISMIDGENIYYYDDKTFELYRCEMDGSNPVKLTEQGVLPVGMNFDDEYLYFRLYTGLELDGADSHDIYRMGKADPGQMEKIAEIPEFAYTIYTAPGVDKIFVTAQEAFVQDAEHMIYAVAKDGSSVEQLQLPDF